MIYKEKQITLTEIRTLLENNISQATLRTWLDGYKFTKFHRIQTDSLNPHRVYSRTPEFFNALYSYLVDRRLIGKAQILKDKLSEEGIEVEYKGFWKE